MLVGTLFQSIFVLLACEALTGQAYNPRPYLKALEARQSASSGSPLRIDLGYEIYEGTSNSTSGVNIWRGIRFAAPPTGSNRWQAPQPPEQNRSSAINASSFAPICPQGPDASYSVHSVNQTGADEDCLFLNVYAPANASSLPVLVWIHGGGYGGGNGRQDLSAIINANNNSFIGVAIQYRLAALGFLSSDEVFRYGVVNAGLLDQHFALQWVQSYISLFGGNASQVTISGESAGGGSVMLQDMAYGGSLGTSLFVNTIAASPYLPMQYGYKDWIPSQAYYAFATAAGCPPGLPYGAQPQTIFECLVSKDTDTLINASATMSQSGNYGTWAFLPVTDGVFIQDLPSRQLLRRKVNGLNALVGNNANEGPSFTPQNVTTEEDLVAWLQLTFPLFTNDDIAKVLLYYPSSNDSTDTAAPLYGTSGESGASALNQSSVGTGQQQRADNIYAETTFVCPSYWMVMAYNDLGRTSYKYQFSVPPALHGADVSGYFGPAARNIGPDLALAFRQIWGNFITKNNPSIPSNVAVGASAANSSTSTTANPVTDWPQFSMYAPYQINLNQTGGTPFSANITQIGHNITEFGSPGLLNDIALVDAWTWEAGRGYRCEFWRSMGAIVPE
ncbi:carboxylesterase 2 [Cladophialophora yegresii CBS 114405]|uniref:Carboxylic ester hydrolase n=1 Tax=Cladophialophora yegresii CBS 114405 TaxID=1182544 RepID=W9WP46_9EURO|nr:carboxylesterase 2 [Cladophialophora yegresii CBS 114405]EXJ60189.1 carboxylesterase 2 [Cladophialophora yegresii CBS 114405]